MREKQTILEQVKGLVERLFHDPICDDCINERLGIPSREEVHQAAQELAGSSKFERLVGACTMCGGSKTVIRCRILTGPH